MTSNYISLPYDLYFILITKSHSSKVRGVRARVTTNAAGRHAEP